MAKRGQLLTPDFGATEQVEQPPLAQLPQGVIEIVSFVDIPEPLVDAAYAILQVRIMSKQPDYGGKVYFTAEMEEQKRQEDEESINYHLADLEPPQQEYVLRLASYFVQVDEANPAKAI